MKSKIFHIIVLLISAFCFSCSIGYCQGNTRSLIDSSLAVNSEKWKVKENNKMFGGLHKPEYGGYTITILEKLDSPVIKKRSREGSELEMKIGHDAEIETGRQVDIDMSKTVTIQKTKFYRLQLSKNADTSEALFSILSSSKERKQTVMGKVLSKKDESKAEVLSYTMDIKGIIATNADSVEWKFSYFNNSLNNSAITSVLPGDTLVEVPQTFGFLKNQKDSLYLKLIIDTSTIRVKKIFSSGYETISTTQKKGIELVNQKGEQLAVLAFAGADGKRYVWMRRDLKNSYTQAISSFLCVIMVI